jgi:hypothetical protein
MHNYYKMYETESSIWVWLVFSIRQKLSMWQKYYYCYHHYHHIIIIIILLSSLLYRPVLSKSIIEGLSLYRKRIHPIHDWLPYYQNEICLNHLMIQKNFQILLDVAQDNLYHNYNAYLGCLMCPVVPSVIHISDLKYHKDINFKQINIRFIVFGHELIRLMKGQ